jgi:hypothetical protein
VPTRGGGIGRNYRSPVIRKEFREPNMVHMFLSLSVVSLFVDCRLRVFENKVLRRLFGPKRDEVTGEWRRLHNKELYALYSSPNIIRVIK